MYGKAALPASYRKLTLMKKLSFFLLCFFSCYASAQTKPELDIFNGLMYAPADMQELKKMADSLSVEFRQCKGPFSYAAWHQAPALRIEWKTKQPIETLISDLEKNTDLKTLKARYGHWITKEPSAALVAHNNREYLAGNANGFDVVNREEKKLITWNQLPRGGWVYRTSGMLSKEGAFNIVTAWQLQKPFQARAIPETYGQLITYVDCLVDNKTPLTLHRERTINPMESLLKLKQYVIGKRGVRVLLMEDFTDRELENYVCAHYGDDETIRRYTDEILLADIEGYSMDYLDDVADEVVPKEKLLELTRSAEVVGFCSMDESPRIHARKIAMLASQTHQWPVFIKAHLNIMNDYMDRRSDGSYAQAGRKTYLKELELLNINTTDLLLGSTLHVSNALPGHYFGDAGRYGRALSETRDPLAFETRLKKMLRDSLLDDFNKLVLFRLYVNYCYNLPSGMEKMRELEKESAAYPVLVREGILYQNRTGFVSKTDKVK